MKQWTEAQKAWMGYKRRQANLDKNNVSLAEPPWKDREISVAPLAAGSEGPRAFSCHRFLTELFLRHLQRLGDGPQQIGC